MLPQYTDQLDKERLETFFKLAAFTNDFVLAGGTAIMLQIGHRKSFDFDCFSQKKLSSNLLSKVKKVFGKKIRIKIKTSEFITFTTARGVEVTFTLYPYKPLRPLVKTQTISLFHLDDLVTNKAYTLGRRPAWRDYVDLFFLLKWKFYSLEKIIKLAEKKFSGGFNGKLFLQQLTYFEDVNVVEAEFLKEFYETKEIKNFLERQVEDHLKVTLSQA